MLSFRYSRKNIQVGKATKKKGEQLTYSNIYYLNGFSSSKVRKTFTMRQEATSQERFIRGCSLGDYHSLDSSLGLVFVREWIIFERWTLPHIPRK